MESKRVFESPERQRTNAAKGATVACLHRAICSSLSHCSLSTALWGCVERICAGLRRAPPVPQPLHRLGGHSSCNRQHGSSVDRWSVLLAGARRTTYNLRKNSHRVTCLARDPVLPVWNNMRFQHVVYVYSKHVQPPTAFEVM